MSENAAIDQVVQQNYVGEGTPTQKGQQAPPPTGKVDPLFLAYFYLMEASNTSAQCAMIHSKQINQNALSQQRLDNQAAGLQWYHMPHEKVDIHYEKIKNTHWTADFWKHKKFVYSTYKIYKIKSYPNAAAVNQAEAQNELVSSERQVFSDKLAVLQQLAQVGETNVNNISDQSMQAMQEGSNLLSVLESLTFAALMTQKPN